MDAPHLLEAEWQRHDVLRKIGQLYDDVWVYGPPDFYDPLTGIETPVSVRSKMKFVGFLQRSASYHGASEPTKDGYLLVTTGGGGDGADLVRDVIAAYNADPTLTQKAVIVLGPYMSGEQRAHFAEACLRHPYLEIIEFDNRMEDRIAGAKAVVAMGGYNTYCEILSFDKPALIVPRTQPREEQLIRATRASELGLVSMLSPEDSADSKRFAAAIHQLLQREPPSVSAPGMLLEGLPNISRIVSDWFERKEGHGLSLVQK
jgi:predicted glycosyltransferase